jgi:hypothetical protein
MAWRSPDTMDKLFQLSFGIKFGRLVVGLVGSVLPSKTVTMLPLGSNDRHRQIGAGLTFINMFRILVFLDFLRR